MTPSEGTDRFWASFEQRPAVMGILNVTPDSFHDGGLLHTVDEAVERAAMMAAAGAAIVDVGGESTRPGHTPVSPSEELDRVAPAIEAISTRVDIPVSIDTTKADVARAAIAAGAHVINDIWGLQGDADMAGVAADHGAGVIAMHNRDTVDADLDIVSDMRGVLERSLEIAAAAGVRHDRVLIDPGIGFGKTVVQNLTAIARLDELTGLAPVLVGLSHKSFIGRTIGDLDTGRLPGTLAANLRAVHNGARVIRVHDVAEHVQALNIWAATTR